MRRLTTINISLNQQLLAQIDDCADALYASRSEYIRHAVIEQMRLDLQNDAVRKTMAKQLPSKYIVGSNGADEFEIRADYV